MIIKVRENENLELRTLVPGNTDEVFEVVDKNREYLRPWLPWVDDTKSPHNTRHSIENWKKSLKNKSEFIFGIFLGGNYIGNMGLHEINRSNNSSEIGYWLAQDYQGMGIMTDCVRALTDFGFDELDLNRVFICCASDNKKSRAVPERLGFVHEAVLQDGICLHGVYHDVLTFGVVKRKWVKTN
ncbi:MAG: GNAT family N-acetyltransferase [Oscillospiraceae bacterium]|nr:GNAT family N-acetyltransferase [Oscillospiraceae bacterium]